MKRLIVIILCLLLPQLANAATKITALGITAEEVAVWNQRRQGLTTINYRTTGDVSTNSPGDWTRIDSNATAFRNAGNTSERWTGQPAGSCWSNDTQPQPALPGESRGEKLRDTAFRYLVTGDTADRDAALAGLLDQAAQAGTNWSDSTRWNNNTGCLYSDAWLWHLSMWMGKLLNAYDYIRHAISAADRANLDSWFTAHAQLTGKNVVDSQLATRFADRYADNYTLLYTTCVSPYLMYFGGPTHCDFSEGWNNRNAEGVRNMAMIGVMTVNTTFINSAKRYFQEWLRFAVYADGTEGQFHRSSADNPPTTIPTAGYHYSALMIGSMITIADVLARNGDTSLYDYSTSLGDPAGAFIPAGGPKTLLTVMTKFMHHLDHTVVRYTAGHNGDANYIIDSVASDELISDIDLAQGNLYYRNAYIKSAYLRTAPGQNGYTTPQYPANPAGFGACVYCGEWGIYPGVLFMFGQMEGVVDPYSTGPPPAPTLTISASPSAIIVGQNSTITWLSSNATSCTASGAWSGTKATSGSELVGAIGLYTLSCTGAGGSVQQSATIVSATSVLKLPAAPSALRLGALSSALKLSAAGGAPPVSLVADDFNRTGPGLGPNWASGYTNYVAGEIVANKVRNTVVERNLIQTWLGTSPGTNHFAQVTLASWNLNSVYIEGGVVLRASAPPTANLYYIVASHGATSTTSIWKIAGGIEQLIAQDASQNWQVGDVIKAGVSGSTIYIYRNGSATPFFTFVDPFVLTGTLTGFGTFTTGALNDIEIDDFDTGSFTAPPTPLPAGNVYWANVAASSGQRCINSATDPGLANSSQTITQGISCLSGGDTLMVRAGTYAEGFVGSQIPNGTASRYTTIRAYGTEVVTIQPTGNAAAFNFGSDGSTHEYIRIEGDLTAKNLVLDNINSTAASNVQFGGGGNGGATRYIEFRGFEAKRTGNTTNVPFNWGEDFAASNIHISYCTVHDNAGNQLDHAFYVTNSSNNEIDHCEIYNISGYGIHNYTDQPTGAMNNNSYHDNYIHNFGLIATTVSGIVVGFGTGHKVYNNVIAVGDSTNDDGSIGISVANGSADVYSNTIYSMQWRGIDVNASGTATIKNNIIASAGGASDQILDQGGSSTISNNLCSLAHANCAVSGDPSFVNAAGGDFHIQTSSPAKDAGADLGASYNVDKDNITRPQGAGWDIGAYEFR